jgi:hypothetical protein
LEWSVIWNGRGGTVAWTVLTGDDRRIVKAVPADSAAEIDMSKTRKSARKARTTDLDRYTPRSLALAEKCAAATLQPRNLFEAALDTEIGGGVHIANLVEAIERTTCAYIKDKDERRSAAWQEAAFLAGMAIGARLRRSGS